VADVKIYDGSQWFSIVGPQGAKGDKGDQGEKGDAGSGVTIKGTATTYPPSATPGNGDMYIVPDPVPVGFPAYTEAGDGLVWSGTAWENVGPVRGPKGEKGDSGNDGADGAAGKDGVPGKDGVDGPKGDDGAPGADGAAGENSEVYVQASEPVAKRAGAIWIEP
jgi:hypothetical protein